MCELFTSASDHSSVDRQGRADDVGSLVRANKHDGIGNFFGGAHALGRNVGLEEIYFVFLRLREMVEHPRFRRARANDVDPNACAGEFDGRRLRDAFHGVLAAYIQRRGRATRLRLRYNANSLASKRIQYRYHVARTLQKR